MQAQHRKSNSAQDEEVDAGEKSRENEATSGNAPEEVI